MAEKLGVYICGGCEIGKALDLAGLAEHVKNSKVAPLCKVIKTNQVLCSPEGVAEIEADIKAEGLDGVVVCACSPRVKWDIFRFGDKIQVERVNLREQCVWSFQDDPNVPGLLPIMAQDYVRMGVTRLSKAAIPAPEIPETNKTLLVLGGGFTGLTAALNAAALNRDVLLVEKGDKLGGKALNMYKTFPLSAPYDKAQETGIEKLVAAVQGSPKIKVLLNSTLESLEGAPGLFKATIGGSVYDVGAAILATGWVPGDGKHLEPFGYGKMKNVVTSAQFEEMAKNGKIVRPSDGKPAASVAFVLDMDLALKDVNYGGGAACEPPAPLPGDAAPAEGEDKAFVYEQTESAKHLSISSEISSLVALKQAGYVAEFCPGAVAMVLYDHMMVPGINEKYYKAAQDNAAIMLTKAVVTGVTESGDGSLSIAAKDTLIGDNVELVADLVVLPTAVVPVTAHEPTMNFVYRQGPHFPDLKLFDGFVDSNYICFPYETRRTGVYAAGCAHQPMTMANAREDAAGAVLKAVQCIESINRGVAVHPRSGDLSFPVFNFVRCTQCKRCTEECPFGALDDDEKGTPKPNYTRCRRCGTCMGACPERVIKFDSYNVDQIGSTIKEVQVPDDMVKGGPRVIVLVCENDAYPALDMAAFRGKSWSPYVRFIPVRCLGSVNAIWVADAMSKGVDGVMLLGCKYGDDYQCHFVKGSELCSRRKENIAESLKRLGVEAERVEQYEVAIDEYDKIPGLIEKFMSEVISKFGPNPFKGY